MSSTGSDRGSNSNAARDAGRQRRAALEEAEAPRFPLRSHRLPGILRLNAAPADLHEWDGRREDEQHVAQPRQE